LLAVKTTQYTAGLKPDHTKTAVNVQKDNPITNEYQYTYSQCDIQTAVAVSH